MRRRLHAAQCRKSEFICVVLEYAVPRFGGILRIEGQEVF
jgi:hypothetical protein